MKPNPGGQIAPENIVGRDGQITRLWGILEGRCVYMNDLRRIGKTQIMVKMHAEPRDGWLTIQHDLEGFHTAAEFATAAYRASATALGTRSRVLRTMQNLLGKLAGTEVAGVLKLPDGQTAPWKEVLTRTFRDLNEEMEKLDLRILFLWDEVPYLLSNIAEREGSQTAMEVLDVLRSLSQDYDRVRLLLTGSVGLHHVLRELQEEGYNGSPLNRMELFRPGPLSADEGRLLAVALLSGLGCGGQIAETNGRAVAELVGHVPFYIHKLVSRLERGAGLTPDGIEAVLKREICSDHNDWDFAHYRERIQKFYEGKAKLTLRVLDAIAGGQPLSFAGIQGALSRTEPPPDDEVLRAILRDLARDHYVTRSEDNQYRFYLEIIRRWWIFDRNLA